MNSRPPFGSPLNRAEVRRALNDLTRTGTQAGPGDDGRKRPDGSYFGDARIAAGLQALAQAVQQQAAPGDDSRKRPDGSYFGDERVRAALEGATQESRPQSGPLFTTHNALNGGEVSPHLLARFDQPRYQTGCEVLENMIPMPQGGITKRPGLVHLGPASGSGAGPEGTARFIPFVFSADESRMLELTGAGNRSTLAVWMPDGSCLETGLHLPYAPEELADLSTAQSADVIFTAHRNHPPAKICRYGDADWRYEVINWMPSIPAPVIAGVRTVGDIPQGEDSRTSYSYVVTAVDAATGEESLPSAAVAVENAAPLSQTYYVEITVHPVEGAAEYCVYKKEGGVYGYIGHIVPGIGDGGEGTDEDAGEGETGSGSAGAGSAGEGSAGEGGAGEGGAGEGTAGEGDEGSGHGSLGAGAAGALVFEDRNIGADTEDTPPNAKNPFDGPGRYPTVVFLHQQRLGFASSDARPLTVWLSQAGNFESMAGSLPPEDDDAIEVTLAAAQANRILWAESDRNGLALGTEGGEWILTGTDGAALTPSNLSFQPQTFHGSQAGLGVLRAGNALLYVQRGGRVIREYGYSFSADRYESGDLSLLARHILRERRIVSWVWQGEPYGVVWCALSDGTLAGLTYMREHDVVGWHRHHTPGGFVEEAAAMPDPDGNTQVWFHVLRNGRRCVERLARFFEGGDPVRAVHTDGEAQTPFTGRCVPCLPESSLSNGTTFLRIRKINAVKCRVCCSSPFTARVGDDPPLPVPARRAGYAVLADWALPLASGWREGDRLELVFDGPEPATVLGLATTVEIADLSGGQQ